MRRLFVFLLPLLAAVGLTATSIVPMSVEELTHRSAEVVRARASTSWSKWNANRSVIYTYTRVQVIDRWKGGAGREVIVKQPGGTADGYTQKVSGVRHLVPGEEAVLFLRPSDSKDGSMVVTGLMQGNFRLYRAATGEVTATNGVPGVRALQDGATSHYRGQRMSILELKQRVERAVQ
jgi:hypothetical protein